MSDDPYSALGLSKSASAAEIKKAYRKLVRTSHPDLHPDDAGAEARFKVITAAHDLLKDPALRARFDAGEIDATGAERPPRTYYRDHADAGGQGFGQRSGPTSGFGDFGDPSDIFAHILRQRARGGDGGYPQPGPDLRYSLEVAFLDAVLGSKTRISLPEGGNLEVRIPKGMQDGQSLRLRGRGGAGYDGGPAGDALVTVQIRPHPVFRREGDDILITLPITIDEAVLGGKVTAPTIDGPVSVNIPKGANSGRILRLRGRGVARASGPAGDALIELRIVTPPAIDAALSDFLAEWRKSHANDPRKAMMQEAAE
ncbi:DnaJ C-terminal domain-containing protein [Cypionkella psychrotolerans]|uniref:DnaJ C-terminal domain-containing protein n=1 Tax=Cypionkella psychrotolerans TaxID=1678131 RepID=UPI0006B54CB5|nr:J domain-containing protein [Cypionkella psychrotolerans]